MLKWDSKTIEGKRETENKPQRAQKTSETKDRKKKKRIMEQGMFDGWGLSEEEFIHTVSVGKAGPQPAALMKGSVEGKGIH